MPKDKTPQEKLIKGNESDCICHKPKGKHTQSCDAYRLAGFVKKSAGAIMEASQKKSKSNFKMGYMIEQTPTPQEKEPRTGDISAWINSVKASVYYPYFAQQEREKILKELLKKMPKKENCGCKDNTCWRRNWDRCLKENYFASEIDKDAIKITMANYQNTKQLGSVVDLKTDNLPKIDLLIGGSPCQSFSNAGRGLGFDGKSKLFWEYVRILKEVQPKYFLLENVKMKKEWENIITEAIGVQPIEINSKFFVPQNRPRLFWTNINVKNIPTAFNHCLNDILDEASDEYYLTEKQKSALDLNYKWSENEIIRHKAGKHQQDNIYRYDGLMACLSASHHGAARHLTKTYLPNGKIRRLTENEVEKLQSVPKDYTKMVSSSKRYEVLGNGWTVDVISFIFSFLRGENFN